MTPNARPNRLAAVLPLALLAVLATLNFVSPAPAVASSGQLWGVDTIWAPTHLAPGGTGLLEIKVLNLGDQDIADPSGANPIRVVDQLPTGVALSGYRYTGQVGWTCSGGTIVTCTTNGPVELPALGPGPRADGTPDSTEGRPGRLTLYVQVSPELAATDLNTTTVSGASTEASASTTDEITFSQTPAGFGILPGSFDPTDVYQAGAPGQEAVRQAASHPFELRVPFKFNLAQKFAPTEEGEVGYIMPEEFVKTTDVRLPRGLIGNPEALPKCDAAHFLSPVMATSTWAGDQATACPPSTQVGTLRLDLTSGLSGDFGTSAHARIPIYNLEPQRGVPADFGFYIGGYVGHILPRLDPAHHYAIDTLSTNISSLLNVRSAVATFWGVPADPAHADFRPFPDPEAVETGYGAPSAGPIRPFLTLPSDCGAENGPFHIRAESWQHPGKWTPETASTQPLDVEGCDDPRFRFEPDVSMQPTDRHASAPTGLTVDLEIPQRNQEVDDAAKLYAQNGNLHGIDTPPLKKAVVTLPQGMTISTSAAQGLGSCTLAQIGIEPNGTPNDNPVTCPEDSRYGQLTLHTPILPKDEPMQGDIYIAKQGENPSHNFLSMYFVIHDEARGLLVKIPGKIELDPKTGQITTTFDDLPQFPVSDMELSFKSGMRAALVNPETCGEKTIRAEFFSWADPNAPITKDSSYQVTQNPDGSPCFSNLAERPFTPELEAGTISNSAGSYSPFVFRLTRTDEDQEFSQLGVTLPPGLSAKIAGISECPDSGIGQAEARTAAGDGALEEADPSCPASSQIGRTDVGSGAGQVLTFIGGKVYLAGPYKGAPLSMVVISPILAGPYDLGVIAVRSALEVNPETTQVTVKSDPLPQIYQGIPVRIRDIRVKVDRPETTINPTSCDPMAITAHVTGVGGDLESAADDTAANLEERFQAASCAGLGFKPSLSIGLSSTKRGAHPALRALLRAKPGNANIAETAVTLPRSEFLDQGHIRNVCERPKFAAHECPQGSIYGYAKAWSPLLDQPLEGPVYLRSAPENKSGLPDMVAALKGQIEVDLVGHIDSVKFSNEESGIRTTFATVPDAPVTKFVLQMKGGAKGLLQNSTNLCGSTNRAGARFTGQNGRVHDFEPVVRNGCRKAHKKKGKHGHRRRRRR